jgi:hypothetical protein
VLNAAANRGVLRGTAGAGNRFAPADFNPVNRFARFLPPSRQAGPGRSVIFWGSSGNFAFTFRFLCFTLLYKRHHSFMFSAAADICPI